MDNSGMGKILFFFYSFLFSEMFQNHTMNDNFNMIKPKTKKRFVFENHPIKGGSYMILFFGNCSW